MSVNFTIQFDASEIEKALNKVKNLVTESAIQEVFNTSSKINFVEKIQKKVDALVNPKFGSTGALKRSIKNYFLGITGVGFEDKIYTTSPYAIYVEKGTGQYATGKSKYKGRPWLYYNKAAEQWFWTSGVTARPFFFATIIENKDNYVKYIAKEFREKFKRLSAK